MPRPQWKQRRARESEPRGTASRVYHPATRALQIGHSRESDHARYRVHAAAGRNESHRDLLFAAETEAAGSEGCGARGGGTKALSWRRYRNRHARLLRVPSAQWRRPREKLPEARGTACRLHLYAVEGFQVRRARRGQRGEGHQRHDHGDDRPATDRRADEGARRIRIRAALASFAKPQESPWRRAT